MEIARFMGYHNSTIPEPIDEKFGVDDYVGNDSRCAKSQNDRPIGGVLAYV